MNNQPFSISRRDFIIGSGAALAVAPGFPLAASTQEATPASPVIQFDVTGWEHRFTVGEFECLAVSDGSVLNNTPNDPFTFYNLAFGASPPEDVAAALAAGGYDASNLIQQFTSVVVKTGDHVVLIDTGLGAAMGGTLLGNLKGAGVEPGDIDVVISTHGHPDHIGGNVDESGAPTYPNARYVMAEKEWDFWADPAQVEQGYPNAAIREPVIGFVNAQMVSIADRYDLVGFEEEIVPGVTSIASPGHTPGHMSLLVQSGGEQLWVGGDFAGHPVVMSHPSLVGYADVDFVQVEATRRSLLQRMVDEGGMVFIGHFDPFPGLGHVVADADVWGWKPAPM